MTRLHKEFIYRALKDVYLISAANQRAAFINRLTPRLMRRTPLVSRC